MYITPILILTLTVGCLSAPVLVEQGTIGRASSPGIIGAGHTLPGTTSISSSSTSTHVDGPLGGEITETRRTTSTSTRSRGVLGALKEAPSEKSAAYISGVVGTGVIGTPVVVATPVVATGVVHRSYPHVGVGLGRVDVTRTETNVISSGVY